MTGSERTFFVTGGSRGIGSAVVLEALRQGHTVAFTYLRRREQAERVVRLAREMAPDVPCRAYQLDVQDSADVDRVGDQVLQDFETVDVVVTNAGCTVDGLLFSLSDQDWHTVIETNLSGTFYVCRRFLPEFLANRGGRFVLVSSTSFRGAPGQASYAASKAGLIGLSGSIAREYGRKGIYSNVVVPGAVDTDMTRDSMSQANQERWVKHCPLGRVATADEIARVIVFLGSDAASFVNGQTVGVDGGLDWVP